MKKWTTAVFYFWLGAILSYMDSLDGLQHIDHGE